MKKFILILLSVLLVVALGGCSAKPSEANITEKNLREIDVVLDWYPNALHCFIYNAIDKGYYEEEGLKVNIRFPANANDAITMVAAEKADFGIYYQHDIVVARENQNVPIKSVGAIVQSPLSIVLSLKDKNIISPADLEGKTIGYSGTELSEAMINSIMKKSGVDPITVTSIDVGFELMSAMTTNNVDATIGCLVNHEVPQMEEQGFEVNYFSPAEYGVPNYYEAVFVASDKTIENDAEMVAAFLRASNKGFIAVKENPEEAITLLLNNQNEENFPLSRTVEEKSLATLLPIMENDDAKFLFQSEDVWQTGINWLFEEGIISKEADAKEMFVNIDFVK